MSSTKVFGNNVFSYFIGNLAEFFLNGPQSSFRLLGVPNFSFEQFFSAASFVFAAYLDRIPAPLAGKENANVFDKLFLQKAPMFYQFPRIAPQQSHFLWC